MIKQNLHKKINTLFNKNGILITESPNEKNEEIYWTMSEGSTYQSSYSYSNTGYVRWKHRNKQKKETIKTRHESPLGFYYWTTEEKIIDHNKEIIEKNTPNTVKNPPIYDEATIVGKNYTYTIKYIIAHGENRIGQDMRPWEIMHSNGMPDHFITDLLNVLETIFKIAKADKINIEYAERYRSFGKYEPHYSNDRGIGILKNRIYERLFGNAKGPRFQTNEEKILAHGFDLKTSFRKM